MEVNWKAPELTDTDPLVNLLSQATEEKNASSTETESNFNPDDFAPPSPEDEDFEETFEKTEDFEDLEEDIESDGATLNLTDAKQQARCIVKSASLLQAGTLTTIHKKRNFSGLDQKRIREIETTAKNKQPQTLSEKDNELISLFAEHSEYVKSLPFTLEEEKTLVDPLALYMQEQNVQMSPTTLLLTAILSVMGPRIIPLLKF